MSQERPWRTRSIHFPGTSIKDFRFFRVVRISVSNRPPAGRQVSLVDAACLSFAEPDGTSSSPPMSGRARPTPLRRLLDGADFLLGQRQLVDQRVDPPICCSGNYSMLCSWVAKGGRMIFDQTLRARSCCQTIHPDAFSGWIFLDPMLLPFMTDSYTPE